MDRFQILEWDSEFFGIPVAQILPDTLTVGEFEQVISSMMKKNVKLAYWASNPYDEESQRAAKRFHGFLADKKVTYASTIDRTFEECGGCGWIIEEYADSALCEDLEALAVQAGIYSRFKRDPRIPEKRFVDLYLSWIRNSVNARMADAVLVARLSGKIVGMVTVGEKERCGCIGLFAVAESMRGRRLGVALVKAAQAWTRRRGLDCARVVTQQENIASCNLYEKCGYRIEKIEYFYHFWI